MGPIRERLFVLLHSIFICDRPGVVNRVLSHFLIYPWPSCDKLPSDFPRILLLSSSLGPFAHILKPRREFRVPSVRLVNHKDIPLAAPGAISSRPSPPCYRLAVSLRDGLSSTELKSEAEDGLQPSWLVPFSFLIALCFTRALHSCSNSCGSLIVAWLLCDLLTCSCDWIAFTLQALSNRTTNNAHSRSLWGRAS